MGSAGFLLRWPCDCPKSSEVAPKAGLRSKRSISLPRSASTALSSGGLYWRSRFQKGLPRNNREGERNFRRFGCAGAWSRENSSPCIKGRPRIFSPRYTFAHASRESVPQSYFMLHFLGLFLG